MSRAYELNAYQYRVNLAANYISRCCSPSRTFDTCFEMYDGDAVATALYRRVQKNPNSKLAENIWKYLGKDTVVVAAEKYADISTRKLPELAAKLRADGRARLEQLMAEQKARQNS